MIRNGFNARAFLSYCIAESEKEADGLKAIAARCSYYRLRMKLLQQMVLAPHGKFVYHLPGIHEQFAHWLKTELVYLEAIEKLPAATQRKNGQEAPPLEKYFTAMTVKELSFSFDMLKAAAIIASDNRAELNRSISATVATEHSEDISINSLRKAISPFDAKITGAVKDRLFDLIGLVNKYEMERKRS